jgi:hypothetical protein
VSVSVGKSKSSVCNISYGVPHLFTSDAPTANGCELAIFTNDTAIFVFNSEPMNVCDGFQSQLNSLTDYFKQWKIKMNASKTQAGVPSTGIVLYGQEVPRSLEVKYLGVTLHTKFCVKN